MSHAVLLVRGVLAVLAVGLVVGYRRVVATVAARQHQELEERRLAEERLRLSMEATRQGWFDLDLETGRVESSEQFAALIGASHAGAAVPMTRNAWHAAVHYDDRPAMRKRFERCLRTGATEQMEYRLKAFDGSFRWIRSIAKVVQHDADGRPLRMCGTHADVTEQMATTLALEASERGYRARVKMSPVGVMVLRDGAVRYANPAAVRKLGAAGVEALVGLRMSRFVPAPSEEALHRLCALASANDGDTSERVELLLRRLDGEVFQASIRCTAVVFEGAPSRQFSFTDISARKRADESRLRSRQFEALGTLAGGIAHNFSNIILAIRGNAELVAEDRSLSAASAEHLHKILVAGQRASDLVRRITAFARPKEPRREPVALPEVLREALRLLRPTIPAGISLDLVVAHDVPAVLADATQVHEAMVNLTANAAYAIGPARVGSITYRVDSVEVGALWARELGVDTGRYARLTVRDTGRGMDAATQRRVFDVFYTTKPVGEGSGPGLSMVYGTMRSHGGVAPRAGPPTGAVRGRRAPAGAAGRTHARPARADRHHDPVLALDAFRREPTQFDVVVTDLSMPRLSGIDFARAVRALRQDVPVIMVTGFADGTDEAEARAEGVKEVAVKAADGHQLARLLAEEARRP